MNNNLQERFKAYIEDNKLLESHDRVLLAVSGGVDSVVMLDLFRTSVHSFGVAHCNFRLRGKDSKEDERFVQSLAAKNELDFHCQSFDTKTFAGKEKISVQMAARHLRYDWFEEVMTRHDYDKLATAHHLNDVLETILFNLTRGTGFSGFPGIKAKEGNRIRPLLFATKQEIEEYAQQKKLDWRIDKSNTSDKYARNMIRNQVIPVLQSINPALTESFGDTHLRLQGTEKLFRNKIDEIKKEAVREIRGHIEIVMEPVRKTDAPVTVLWEILKVYGFNFRQVKQINEAVDLPGRLFFSAQYTLNVDRERLIISKPDPGEFPEVEIGRGVKYVENRHYQLTLKVMEGSGQRLSSDLHIAYLDREKISFPLIVRKWKEGDRFQPLGMKGQKKLSDFMIDSKIPVNLKEQQYVLTSGNDIVWVVGQRIDDRYKVTDETPRILKIEAHPKNDQSI